MASLSARGGNQKRTGVYAEDWRETALGSFTIEADGVAHVYEQDPYVDGNHWHGRDGSGPLDYGRHVHDRWDEPHRHLHPGDKRPSEARQEGFVRELPAKERHHSHRIYVNESVSLNEAIDKAVMAVRMGSAAYEDGRWRDAHGKFGEVVSAMTAAVQSAQLLVSAMYDLWDDGGPCDRRVVELESQALGGSIDLEGGSKVTTRRRAAEPEGRPRRAA